MLSSARNISGVVAGAFGTLCPAIVKRPLLETSTAYGSTSSAALQRAVDQLNAALGETVLSVEVTTTTVRSHLGAGGSSSRGGGHDLLVERPMLKVTELDVREVGAAIQRLNVILEALNAVLLVGAIRESFKREGRDDITRAADALRLVKSVVSLSEGYVTLRGVKTVTTRKLAEAVAGRLALVGAAIDFLAASADAVQNFRTGDADAAAGNIATATGSG